MGCCSSDANRAVNFDEYHLIERNIGLGYLNILEFSQRLEPYKKQLYIDLPTLTLLFKDYEFGQALSTPRETEVKILIKHPLFYQDQKVDLFSLVCLALVYCDGSLKDKTNVIWDNFDKNQDGQLFINTIRKMLSSIFTIAGIIVPALDQVPRTKKVSIKQGCIRLLCEERLSKIFKNEIRVKKSNLYSLCKSTLDLCGHPVHIRQKLRMIQLETNSRELE